MRFYEMFFNYVIVAVEGGNIEILLTRIMSAGISPRHVIPTATGVAISIPARSYKKVRILRRKTGCKLFILRKKGFYFPLKRFFNRPSLVLSIALFLLLIQFFSALVWRIDTSNIPREQAEYIKAELYSKGIYPGSFANSEVFKQAEREILLESESLSYIKLNFNQGRLEVKASSIIPREDVGRSDISLVAAFDGIIHEIKVYDGHSLVTKNQSVTKGQTLVSNLQLTYKNELVITEAFADITGYGQTQYSYFQPLVSEEQLLSGKEKQRYVFVFLDTRLPLYFNWQECQGYNQRTIISPLNIFGFKLPFTIERTTFQQYETHIVNRTIEQATAHAELQMHRQFLRDYNNPEVVVRLVSSEEAEQGVLVTVKYEFLADIVEK